MGQWRSTESVNDLSLGHETLIEVQIAHDPRTAQLVEVQVPVGSFYSGVT